MLTIERTYRRYGTYGIVFTESDPICMTLERPWISDPSGLFIGGKPFESCIPEGIYRLKPALYVTRKGTKYETFVFINHDLGVAEYQHEGDHVRYACKIHPANKVEQLSGCTAPISYLDGKSGCSSMKAYNILMKTIREKNIKTVEIKS